MGGGAKGRIYGLQKEQLLTYTFHGGRERAIGVSIKGYLFGEANC